MLTTPPPSQPQVPCGLPRLTGDTTPIHPSCTDNSTPQFYSTTGDRYLYSIPTTALLSRSQNADLLARPQIMHHGEIGLKDGLESDTSGLLYASNIEANSVTSFNPTTGELKVLARDPRFSWTDTFSVGADGYLYFTENQLALRPQSWYGVDRRVKPWALFRLKIEGVKVQQSAPGS